MDAGFCSQLCRQEGQRWSVGLAGPPASKHGEGLQVKYAVQCLHTSHTVLFRPDPDYSKMGS